MRRPAPAMTPNETEPTMSVPETTFSRVERRYLRDEDNRTAQLSFRLSPEEKDTIAFVATALGIPSQPALIRTAIDFYFRACPEAASAVRRLARTRIKAR